MEEVLHEYFTITIKDGSEEMLESPPDCNIILTQVSIANPSKTVENRIKLCGSVELMRPDKPKVDGEYDSDFRDFVIASFFPGGPIMHNMNLGFSPMEICYLLAKGGDLLVSGYTAKTSQKFTRFEEQ